MMFGLMKVSTHEERVASIEDRCDRQLVSVRKLMQEKHDKETQLLRGEITALKNELAQAKGKATADAHKRGKRAP